MTQPKTPASNPKALNLTRPPGQTEAQALSRAALRPCINGASVIEAYQVNLMGKEVDLGELVAGLRESCNEVKGGDLSTLEAMLIAQATALQTMFASLARRAATQEQLRQYETFMGLALKAQAQSRATITALVDLKYPRQATFVKQANIAHGPQQVNNGMAAGKASHAKKTANSQNKLLELHHEQEYKLDASEAGTAGRAHSTMATVEKIYRPQKRRR